MPDPFWMSALQPELTVWVACFKVSLEQGEAEQMPEIHVVRGVRMDPEAPMTETKPMMFEQLPNSLVSRPPAAAWHPGERPAARLRADEDPPVAGVTDEELPPAEEPAAVVVLAACPRTAWLQ